MRLCAGFLLLLLSCASAAAEPLTGAAREALAGEWRANPDKPDGACGPDGGPGDIRMVIEFALTGGSISLDDGSEGGGEYAIASGSADKAHVALALKDGGTLSFTRANGLLKAASSDDVSVGIGGMNFKRCREPAGRSAIKLSKAQIAEISSALPPKNYVFVDMRAKAGCKALDYQYVFFDLVGPLGFSAGRWNSYDLAERLAGGKKPSLAIDEIANFTIDKAEAAPNGTRLTLTELIPPNGSRGDTTTITLTLAKNGTAAIPEWKRTYRRCAQSDLAAQ